MTEIGAIGGKELTQEQLKVLSSSLGGEEKVQKLIDLFNEGEDADNNGFMNEALDLGFNKTELEILSEADGFFKGLLDGSLTIGDIEKGSKTEEKDEVKDTNETKTFDEVKGLEEEASALRKEISELDTKISEQKEKLEAKEAELKAKEDELNKEKAELDEAKEKQAELQRKYDENKEAYEKINKEINDATQKLEDDMKEKQQNAIYKAMENYDENKDGSWNSYLTGVLEKEVSENPALANLINSLSSKETSILKALGSLQPQLTAQNALVAQKEARVSTLQTEYNSLNDEVSSIKANIETMETEKGAKQASLDTKTAELESAKAKVEVKSSEGVSTEVKVGGVNPATGAAPGEKIDIVKEAKDSKLTKKEVLEKVLPEELELVKEHNIDLTAKLEDGSPRYIIAKGALDDEYHIYDMCPSIIENCTYDYHPTLMREFKKYTQESICAIPFGNGYITDLVKCPTTSELYNDGAGGAGHHAAQGDIFYIDDCDSVKEVGDGNYMTCSPLSFDLNGDGVKTSDEIVEFDIDGDGVVDKINDSADAVLVFDKDGDGISGEDGSECFGDNTDIDGDGVKDGYKDGFEALKAFARDKGLINDADDMVLDENDIKYLEENFGFGIKAGGYTSETQTLTELGITEINLAKTDKTSLEDNFDGKGNQLMTQEGTTFVQNGETKEYADIWHRKLDENAESANKADTAAKKAGRSGLSFGSVASLYDSANVWSDILNSKLELEASKKADKDSKFNVFDVDVQKPEGEDKDKKDKKKIDGKENAK